MFTVRSLCSMCGSTDLQEVISLGSMPLSNSFLASPNQAEEKYPLTLVFCPECSLVQLKEVIPPDVLFRDYIYFSSQSQTMLDHSRDLAAELIKDLNLGKESLVIEPASNDGYMLQYFMQADVPVLGIEPASNIASIANDRGIPTLNAFFGEGIGSGLQEKADVLLALNVLGHVDDLNGFVRGIKGALKPSGIAVIEVPYVRDMVEDLAWDTIYHEHLSYFSLRALTNLFKWNGMQIIKARRVDIHCGSLRLYVGNASPKYPRDRFTESLLSMEGKLGMDRPSYYQLFGIETQKSIEALKSYLLDLRDRRIVRIIGYGAAAKGVILLNAAKIGWDILDYVVDSTPSKIGKYLPGVHLRVLPPEEIGNPDYILLLARNFKEEITAKHPGKKWIVPLPKVELIIGGQE